jgi:glycerophosphoryl diester phosphodiesterase
MHSLTKLPLIQLVAGEGGPADKPGTSYADMLTAEGLAAIAGYATGIGAEKLLVIPRTADNRLAPPTDLVARAHRAGLKVHLWTFRPENYFLPAEVREGDSPRARGDGAAEIRAYLATGIDGLFSDSTPTARAALDAPRR